MSGAKRHIAKLELVERRQQIRKTRVIRLQGHVQTGSASPGPALARAASEQLGHFRFQRIGGHRRWPLGRSGLD